MDKSYKSKRNKQRVSFQPCTFHVSGHKGSPVPTQLQSQTEIISSEGQTQCEVSHKSQLIVDSVLQIVNPTFWGI